MTCPNCEFFPELEEIRSPAQLRTILKKITFAVESGQLIPEGVKDFDDQQKSQGRYEELTIEGPWPDILDFFFLCATCGQRFHVVCDTCHGSGGEWTRM